MLAALAAAGCQVILFSTGIGAPQGFPFVPVLKISGNEKTVVNLPDFIDIDVLRDHFRPPNHRPGRSRRSS